MVDVRKEISFCNKMQVPTIGIIENMSGLLWMCTRTHVCGGRVGQSGGGRERRGELQLKTEPFDKWDDDTDERLERWLNDKRKRDQRDCRKHQRLI